MQKRYNNILPFLMWLLPLSFFTYQFILRLWPGLMMQQMMQQFAISAKEFGLLASFYYYGYAGMQIPIAIAFDRYQPKYVIFCCAITCGIASFMLNYTDSWTIALISRFLIGSGSAAGFLGTSKIISQWFAKDYYAKMIGFSFTIGLMGAIYGGKPINLLITNFGINNVIFAIVLVALLIGLIALCFLNTPNVNNETIVIQEKLQFSDFKQLISSRVIWALSIANLLMVGSLEGFADVWGIPYLVIKYSISKSDAAALLSFIFIGMLFGGPILAIFAKKFGNYLVISLSGICMAVIFIQLLWFGDNNANLFLLRLAFTLVGIMCCYQVLVFAVSGELVEARLLGITVAFLNCINMLGGAFFHTIIGFIMDLFWSGNMENNIRIYSLESYNYSLSAIPICAIIGAFIVYLLSILIKNKRSMSR